MDSMEARKRKFIENCIVCGACLEQCPLSPWRKFGRLGSVELMDKILKVLEKGEISEEVYDTLWSCMGCTQCNQWCPVDISPAALFSLARMEMSKRGQPIPSLLYQWVPSSPYNFSSVLSSLQIKPSSARWLSQAPEDAKPVDVVLFLGCYVLSMPNIVFTLLDILESMGIDFVALGGGGLCCGAGHYLVGDTESADRAIREAFSNIMAFKPKLVLFECGTCYVRFASLLPRLFDVPFQCQKYIHFLADNLDKIQFAKSINKVVAYHDSCDTRRAGGGDYDTPRKLLQAIPGITLVEMEHSREDSLCCGGIANSTYPDVTRGIRQARLEEAKATGAELLVTSCRICYSALAGLDEGHPTVTDDITLLGEAIGINYENKFKEYLYRNDWDNIVDEARDNIESNNLDPDEVRYILPRYLDGLQHRSS